MLTDVWRRTKFTICLCASACVSCLFLIRQIRSLPGKVCSVDGEQTQLDKGDRWIYRSHALCWHMLCSEFVRSLSCNFPVHISWCPMNQIPSWTTTWLLREVFRTLTTGSGDDYAKNVLSVSSALHFHSAQYLSVTNVVISVYWQLIVLYMFSNHAVIMCLICSIHQTWESRAAVVTSFITE